MGFKEFLDRQREKRLQRTITRNTKKLTNKHQQTQERKRCIENLAAIGSEEAIAALLKRFTYRTDGPTVDEEEKQLAYEHLLSLGGRSIKPLTAFVKSEIAVYWPVKTLTELAGVDYVVDLLIEQQREIEETYGRELERKIELVSNLREFRNERVRGELLELVNYDSEDIRILAIDGLCQDVKGKKDESVLDIMVERLLDEEETVRVKNIILAILVDQKWKVKKYKAQLQKVLPHDQYWIDDTGVVRRHTRKG